MSSVLDPLAADLQILVVDDFATMRRIVRSCLSQLGFKKITEAEDGQIALSKLESIQCGLIISDWNMPNMMGIDLLRAVRADDRYKSIPFLMITAEGLKENVMEAVKAGVSSYIVKPFNTETLGAKLEGIFSKKT